MSISKAQIKEIRSLQLPKYRQMYNKFIAEGAKSATEFIRSGKYLIHQAYILEDTDPSIQSMIKAGGMHATTISLQAMEQISAMSTASGVLLLLERKEDLLPDINKAGKGILYLDGVQDPGNVGTIIRIADWFGIGSVIRSPDSADFFNPKVVQATMGSMNNVSLLTAEFKDIVQNGKPVFGTFIDGVPYQQVPIPTDSIVVLGSEGKGISSTVSKEIDHRIAISGSPHRIADSLNVSVATGLIAAHWKAFL